jgi:hypothetical protein
MQKGSHQLGGLAAGIEKASLPTMFLCLFYVGAWPDQPIAYFAD